MIDSKLYDEIKSTGHLPSPKGAALRVMELCRQDNTPLAEIVRTLNTDPALAGQVINMANSPVYARPRPVVAISPEVVISIGIQTLRQVVLAFSLISAYRKGECKEFDYAAFWSRSVATALAASNLGSLIPVAPHAEMFTCGLLAGVGRLALSTVYPESYSNILARCGERSGQVLLDMEQREYALNHNQLTAAMLVDWGIPKLFGEAIQFHENPAACDFTVGSRSYRMVYLLHLASQLAESCFIDHHERSAQLPRLFAMAESIGVASEQMVSLGDRMLEEWRDWSRLLQLKFDEGVEPFSALDEISHEVADDFADQDFTRGIRIVIAGDDAALLLLLSKKLTSLGYEVFTAVDGRQALECVAAHAPQIVLSDVQMPEINGIELCRIIRQAPSTRGMYYILLTANKDKGHLVAAFQAGVDDFITKPVEVSTLLGRMVAGTRIVRLQQRLEMEQALLRSQDDVNAAESVNGQAAAMLDPVTGLPNRYYAMSRLGEQWKLAERNDVPFSCLRVSVGPCAAIEERYGAAVTSELFHVFATLMRESSRGEDVICCLDAGEFLIINPHSVLTTAMRYAGRLLAKIANSPLKSEGRMLDVTVSIGAAAKGDNVKDEAHLLHLAELALAQSAQRGGACAVSAVPDASAAGGAAFQSA